MSKNIEQQYADEISKKLESQRATIFDMKGKYVSPKLVAMAVRARGHISIVLDTGDVYSAIQRHNMG